MSSTEQDRVEEFQSQRWEYLEKAKQSYPGAAPTLDLALAQSPLPIAPTVVDCLDGLTPDEAEEVAKRLCERDGVALVIPVQFDSRGDDGLHPQVAFAQRLSQAAPIGYPLDHPMEGHHEAVSRFGKPDGTLKIYNLPKDPSLGYREQAETDEMFHMHNDGLGYAGLIRTAILTLDHPPLWGGYTYFQNFVALSIAIAGSDPAAFKALFRPNAITVLRPRGKGAIRVTSPVLYLGPTGEPQAFMRVTTGEYVVSWNSDPDLERAQSILREFVRPFAPGSSFVHAMRPGETMVMDNQRVPHARTPFVDPPAGRGRTLARKWFVREQAQTAYRHVPGMVVDPRWAGLYPAQFGDEAINGDWNYADAVGDNVRSTQ